MIKCLSLSIIPPDSLLSTYFLPHTNSNLNALNGSRRLYTIDCNVFTYAFSVSIISLAIFTRVLWSLARRVYRFTAKKRRKVFWMMMMASSRGRERKGREYVSERQSWCVRDGETEKWTLRVFAWDKGRKTGLWTRRSFVLLRLFLFLLQIGICSI